MCKSVIGIAPLAFELFEVKTAAACDRIRGTRSKLEAVKKHVRVYRLISIAVPLVAVSGRRQAGSAVPASQMGVQRQVSADLLHDRQVDISDPEKFPLIAVAHEEH